MHANAAQGAADRARAASQHQVRLVSRQPLACPPACLLKAWRGALVREIDQYEHLADACRKRRQGMSRHRRHFARLSCRCIKAADHLNSESSNIAENDKHNEMTRMQELQRELMKNSLAKLNDLMYRLEM